MRYWKCLCCGTTNMSGPRVCGEYKLHEFFMDYLLRPKMSRWERKE